VLGAHVEGGGFHVKTAGLLEGRPLFAAKVNANFPGNPARFGLPTIQGVVALFDAERGALLALLDSAAITSLRTAAATGAAARYLAREGAAVATVCGCGEQGRSQLRALVAVRPIRRAMAFDVDAGAAERYALEMARELEIEVTAVGDLAAAARRSDVVVTCTPARRWILGRGDVAPGAFVAAVGADWPEKQEVEPALMAASSVVVDVLEQCERIGDLHHAIAAGVMTRDDVAADLAEVVSGRRPGRRRDDEVVVFDSTGTALQDVAAVSLAYERAIASGVGVALDLGTR
jgi:ornithine cyclodeaminase/alanine dehydrogenase-like protein (mu-crystallin family)